MERASGSRYLLAGALTFVTTLTIGNDPYLFFGYGASALGMLVTGLALAPVGGTLTFLVASALAVSLVAFTHSAFTLVIVGAVLVRTVQVYVLSRLNRRVGPVAASAGVVLLGTVVATLLGFAFYGGQALVTTMTWFDAFFILPAWLLHRAISRPGPGSVYLGISAVVVAVGTFLSASPFPVPAAMIAGGVLLAATAYASFRGASKRTSIMVLVLILLGMPLALATGGTAASYNVRSAFYPLYPDSLSSTQWVQSNPSSGCMQGNLAGAGTIQDGVWGPQRLRVLDTCTTVSGVVEGIGPTSGPSNDGDFGIDIKMDPQYNGLLSVGNIVLEGSLMHVEVVPSQQSALASALASLKPGDRVTVTGALVLDTDHGWGAEIHPVWSITPSP